MTEAEAREMRRLRHQVDELGRACWVLRETLDQRYHDGLDTLTRPDWIEQVQARQQVREVHQVLRVA